MQTFKVILSSLDSLGRRLVKGYRYGNIDVRTPLQANPSGFDSNPIKDMVAIYSNTDNKDTNIIVGYLNKNQLADSGEARVYSTDSEGNLKTYIWLKNNGNIELGGTADYAVRFTALQTALEDMVTIINENLPLIASGIVAGGGTYTPIDVILDLTPAKITTITTP